MRNGLASQRRLCCWSETKMLAMLKNPLRWHFLLWNNATRPLQNCLCMQIDPWSLIWGKTGPTQLYDPPPPMTHLRQTPHPRSPNCLRPRDPKKASKGPLQQLLTDTDSLSSLRVVPVLVYTFFKYSGLSLFILF